MSGGPAVFEDAPRRFSANVATLLAFVVALLVARGCFDSPPPVVVEGCSQLVIVGGDAYQWRCPPETVPIVRTVGGGCRPRIVTRCACPP